MMRLFGRRESTASTTTESGVHVDLVQEDIPKFRRRYSAKLDDRAYIKIELYTGFGRRCCSGELTQPNGRWLLFDPERIADKILDPKLLPLVEGQVAEIFKLDKEFLSSDPGSFIDEMGRIWRRE